jgi:adenylate kinase
MERIILFGMPGAGKGTQAAMMESELGYRHISTGDLIRREVAQNTPVGLEIRELTQSGQLVPDEIILDMVREVLNRDDIRRGYLLDGFPRTLNQARKLAHIPVDRERVIYLQVDEQVAVSRIMGRITCPGCKKTYRVDQESPEGRENCKECGTPVMVRKDDSREVVKSRIQVYQEETLPLIDYYRSKGELISIDGDGTEQQVFTRIMEKLV